MKLAIASRGRDLNAEIDGRFGRAPYFIVIDPESMEFEAVENTRNLNAPQGAGIQSAQAVASKGADYVIAGHCGPKAFKTLSAAGIRVIVGVEGTVAETVGMFKRGELRFSDGPDVEGGWV